MAFRPLSTKRSSRRKAVGWSTVQPKTLAPNTSGAICRPERPRGRWSIAVLPLEVVVGAGLHHGRAEARHAPLAAAHDVALRVGGELRGGLEVAVGAFLDQAPAVRAEQAFAALDRRLRRRGIRLERRPGGEVLV